MKEAEEQKQIKDQMEEGRKVAQILPGVLSMQLDIPQGDVEELEEEPEDDVKPIRKIPERKTKAERRKAEQRKAEVCQSLPVC